MSDPAPLPLILLADTSGSMLHEGKIAALNAAIRDLLALATRPGQFTLLMAVIAVGGEEAHLVHSLAPAGDGSWTDLSAGGGTPLASGLRLVQALLEARPGDAVQLRPVIILASDGHPSEGDPWRSALAALDASPAGAAADRLALAIGPDTDRDLLERFVKPASSEARVSRIIGAGAPADLIGFFRALPGHLGAGLAVTPLPAAGRPR